jgi:UDPglucose 6-dehydrogenase
MDLQVLAAVTRANESQKLWVAEKILKHFKDLRGKKIAVWGLAFKPGTDDVRDSPAKTIVRYLAERGAAVVGHDPEGRANFQHEMGDLAGVSYVESAYEALRDADAVALVTEWSEYKRPNWDKAATLMRSRVVFDLRNQYNAKTLTKHGFHYECVGRPAATAL